MFTVRHVAKKDRKFWLSLDTHATDELFESKIVLKQGYMLYEEETPVGIMHYNLFWDTVPFLNLIFIDRQRRGKGCGSYAMNIWEAEMKDMGYKMTMVSTRADESAQHFYRKIGYRDCGCLILDGTPLEQPAEIFLIKTL